MKKILAPLVLVAALAIGGCSVGTIETGNVGVQTTFGKVDSQEMTPGFYMVFFTNVEEYSNKNIEVQLLDMKPRAMDNLTLADLDISIYYTVAPGAIADLKVKYSGQDVASNDGKLVFPAYGLVTNLARNAVYEKVSKLNSLDIHQHREDLENGVQQTLQKSLDESDKGVFTVQQVVVRQLNTDAAIEASIRNVIQKQKELEAMGKEKEIQTVAAEIALIKAVGIANANKAINHSLTREYLQHEANEVLKAFAANPNGTNTIVVPANMNVAPLINVPTSGKGGK